MKIIVTHASNFHPDDLFGTAALIMLLKNIAPKEKVKIIRSIDPNVWARGDFVLDVGSVYAPTKNRFDHHQYGGAGARENGIPYAAFGLVWKKYGKKICGSQKIADYVEKKLVIPFDMDDNGIISYTPTHKDIEPPCITGYIYLERNTEKDSIAGTIDRKLGLNDLDKKFMSLLPFAERVITTYIKKGVYKMNADKVGLKLYKSAKDKRIIIMNSYVGFNFFEFPEPLVTVYPEMRGGWSAKVVRASGGVDSSSNRMLFPKSWAGKEGKDLIKISGVVDAKFCHNGRFLVSAGSKDGVLELVKKALLKK